MTKPIIGKRTVVALAVLVALAGCSGGKDEQANLAQLDAQLTGNAGDAAAAIQPGDAPAASAAATKLAGGALRSTPAAKPCPDCSAGPGAGKKADTLGGLANQQGNTACGKVSYGNQWAKSLPEPFTLYPGATLAEAAGVDGKTCRLRVASFTTPVAMQAVMDFYYTRATRAGFDAEHVIMDGDHVLGGTRTRDDGAYILTFKPGKAGGTAVDIVASHES